MFFLARNCPGIDARLQAVEVGVSCIHSRPSPDSKVELLTPSHCHLDGHALKVRG